MQNHEAISCLNMNECCVNASAVIFRQVQIPLCCCCVFSRSSRECCYCYDILQGGNALKCLCLRNIPGNLAENVSSSSEFCFSYLFLSNMPDEPLFHFAAHWIRITLIDFSYFFFAVKCSPWFPNQCMNFLVCINPPISRWL